MQASVCTDSVQTASFAQFSMAEPSQSHDSVVNVVFTSSTTTTVWPPEENGNVVNAYDTAPFRGDRMSLVPEREPVAPSEHEPEDEAEPWTIVSMDQKDEAELDLAEMENMQLALVQLNDAAEMLSLTRAEQMQLVMSEALCASTFPFNDRMNMWLQELLPGAADQLNLERFCNVRIPIPGWAGDYLEFRPEGGGTPPLMFPIIWELGLSMYHGCDSPHSLTRLEFCDIWGVHMGQLWVWCAYCQKFQCPAEGHRGSRRHQDALANMERHGPGYCTEWARRPCRDRWL